MRYNKEVIISIGGITLFISIIVLGATLIIREERDKERNREYEQQSAYSYERGEPLNNSQKLAVRRFIERGGHINTDPRLMLDTNAVEKGTK